MLREFWREIDSTAVRWDMAASSVHHSCSGSSAALSNAYVYMRTRTEWRKDSAESEKSACLLRERSTFPIYLGSIRNGVSLTLRGSNPVFLVSIAVVIFARDVKVIARRAWDLIMRERVRSEGWLSRGIIWLYLDLKAWSNAALVSRCVGVSTVNWPTFIEGGVRVD